MDYKTCTKCGKELPATTEFFHKGNSKYGLRGDCKECHCERMKQYNETHKEEIKKYYEQNKEKVLAHSRQWRKDNKEKHDELKRQWRKNNPDKVNATALKSKIEKIQRTVPWHRKDIEIVYEMIKAYLNKGDDKWELDHVIPLQGEKAEIPVSGLHVHNNMRLTRKSYNSKKGAKYPYPEPGVMDYFEV